MTKFEQAFIQCLKDGVYPSPSNINERRGQGRFNRLNGQCTTKRLELMYAFGVQYMRGNTVRDYNDGHVVFSTKGIVPEWPYLTFGGDNIPDVGYRKHEIQDP